LAFIAAPAAAAQNHQHSPPAAVSAVAQDDPFAPVFVVTSATTYRNQLQGLATAATARRDSTGAPLVVSRVQAHQLPDVAQRIHENENRCGGFFAFASQAEADSFIRDDRSAQALTASALAAYTIDNASTVNPWLGAVEASRIRTTIGTLSAYTNRYYSAPTGKTSAESIRSSWDALAAGRSDASSELFACGTCSTQPSVILTVQGSELPNEIVVLGAHLDSINGSAGGSSTQVAPGADDDASGIATLTEVIRIAMANGWRPKRTVKFMGYAAEEVGLRGSNAIATSFRNAGKNVVGAMQLDMTNYKTGGKDMQLVTDYSNADMKVFLTSLFDTYLAPLGMARGSYTCGYGCSDHASWTSAGYPSAMMFEGGAADGSYNPYIHSANDTLANMGNTATPSVAFAKLGLAFIGELAKTSGGGNAAPVANFTASVSGNLASFSDTSTDSDGSIVTRSWNFGDGSTGTGATVSHTYAANGTYSAVLTVTDNGGATASRTLPVTIGDAPPQGLQNGVPLTGLSAATGTSLNYSMTVPAGAVNLTFTTSGGTGDSDMYVKFGSAPTDTVYDCRPYKSGNAESCTFAAPSAGTYHVRLKAYAAFSGMSLVGQYTGCADCGPGPLTYTNGTDYAIADNATVDSPITVSGRTGNGPASAVVAVNIAHTYRGDLKVDLVAPDGSLYNISNRAGGSADNIIGNFTFNLTGEVLNGTWKLRVNDNASGDTGRIDSWSITL